jgi:hypothetical protein
MRRSVLDVEALRRVDAGGPVEVWRGRLDGADVAVKRAAPGPPDPATLAALEREAAAQARVSHPNVLALVAVHADPEPGAPALVTRWARGGALAANLDDPATNRWTVDQVAALLAALAEGLDAVHAAGLVHGDLSTGNVLLDDEGRPKLADFGSAETWTAGGADEDRAAVVRLGRTVLDRVDPDGRAGAAGTALTHALDLLAGGPDTSLAGWAAEVRRQVPGAAGGFRRPTRLDADPLPGRRRTVEWGPRPPRAEVVAPVPSRGRPVRVLAAAGLGVLGSLAITLAAARLSPHPAPHRVEAVRWSGQVLTLPVGPEGRVARFRVGRPGDRLLMGRWGCAARATPALYRPATGDVLVYRSLPRLPGAAAGIAPVRRASGVVNGEAAVGTDRHGCDVVAVRPRTLDLGRRVPRR